MGHRIALVLLALAVAAGPVAAAVGLEKGKTYIFKRRTGPDLTGTITELDEDEVVVLLEEDFSITLLRDDIVEVTPTTSAREEFEAKAKGCESAEDWYRLGRWAKEKKLRRKSEEAFQKAIEIDRDHEGARKELGFVKYEGRWLPEDEAARKKGWKRFRGKWLSPGEYEKAVRAREKGLRARRQKEMADIVEEFVVGRPWADVAPIPTAHYRVKCDSTEEVANEYAQLMETLYRAYDAVFPATVFPRIRDDAPKVYIWKNQEEFRDMTLAALGVGGFFNFQENIICAFHGGFGQTGTTYEVLAHEGTHQFQYRFMKAMRSVPIWVIEGMAVYFGEGAKIAGRKVELHQLPRDRIVTLKKMIEDESYIPIRRLIRTPQLAFGGNCYATAWAVLYWCLRGDQLDPPLHGGEGRELLDAYVKHCAELDEKAAISPLGGPKLEAEAKRFEKMVKEKLKRTIDEWDADLKAFILGLKLDPLGRWRGDVWESKLRLRAERPVGMRTIPDRDLLTDEALALQARVGGGRIGVIAAPNFMRIRATPQIARQIIEGSLFKATGQSPEPAAKLVGGFEAVEAEFLGRRIPRVSRTFGQGEAPSEGEEEAKAKAKARRPRAPQLGPVRRVRLVLLATPDHIFTIVCESDPQHFERDNEKYYTWFLEHLRIG